MNIDSEPVATSRSTLTASDATATRPFDPLRERLRFAMNPGVPKSAVRIFGPAAAAPRALRAERPIARRARRVSFTSCVWRMASVAATRPARSAGIHALTKIVTRESATESAMNAGFTLMDGSSIALSAPTSAAQPSPVSANTTAVPAIPSTPPTGMPATASIPASASTLRRSCRLDAPSEDNSPNWRVRSDTEIANAL